MPISSSVLAQKLHLKTDCSLSLFTRFNNNSHKPLFQRKKQTKAFDGEYLMFRGGYKFEQCESGRAMREPKTRTTVPSVSCLSVTSAAHGTTPAARHRRGGTYIADRHLLCRLFRNGNAMALRRRMPQTRCDIAPVPNGHSIEPLPR